MTSILLLDNVGIDKPRSGVEDAGKGV
jgi:hypothetical protein